MNDYPNENPGFTEVPSSSDIPPATAEETIPGMPQAAAAPEMNTMPEAPEIPEPVDFTETPAAQQMPQAPELQDDSAEFCAPAPEAPAAQETAAQYNETAQPDSGSYEEAQAPVEGNAQQNDPANRNPYSANMSSNPYGARPRNRNPYSAGNGGRRSSGGSAYPYGANVNNPYVGSAPQTVKKKNGGKIFVICLALILVFVLGMLISGVIRSNRGEISATDTTAPGASVIDNVDEATTAASPQSAVDTSSGAKTPTEIYNSVLPSSVGILVYSNSSKKLASEGSGVIYTQDKDGEYTYIVTCAHVIRGVGQSIVVQMYNEKEYPAEVVGYDSRTDIGVVRIKAAGLQTLEIGDSSSLRVGDTIYAIGNPGGTEFANTFTNGIITALDRPVASSSTGYTMECIQHNAAINPGNSGGALVNEYGQLIGINSMKIVAADYEGMGFAVPSSVFVDIVNDLVVNHYVTNRAKIGISYLKASAEQAYAMFVAIKGLPSGSIIVAEIAKDSDFYGKLKQGDLITAFNGKDLNSSADLAAFIEDMKVGDEISLHVVRIKTDYSFDEFTIKGKLVEDKETTPEETEEESTTSSSFEDFFGEYFGDSFGDEFGDEFGDSFDDFFGRTP